MDYVCGCRLGFSGPLCLTPRDHACLASPCLNGGTCDLLTLTEYKCLCPPGWSGEDPGGAGMRWPSPSRPHSRCRAPVRVAVDGPGLGSAVGVSDPEIAQSPHSGVPMPLSSPGGVSFRLEGTPQPHAAASVRKGETPPIPAGAMVSPPAQEGRSLGQLPRGPGLPCIPQWSLSP